MNKISNDNEQFAPQERESRGISGKARTLALIAAIFFSVAEAISQIDAGRNIGEVKYLEVDAYLSLGAQTNTAGYNKDNLHNGTVKTMNALHVDKYNHEMITANLHKCATNDCNR